MNISHKLLLLALFSTADADQVSDITLNINGGWSEWQSAGPCCDGFDFQTRTCTDPPPQGDGTFCAGPDRLSFTCEADPIACVNGGWSDWGPTGPCCYGSVRRTRECLAPTGCEGLPYELTPCTREGAEECFTANSETSMCDEESFDNVTPDKTYELKEDCCSANFASNYDTCVGRLEGAVDGGWGEWTEFGRCCYGSQSRYRACDSPPPSLGGTPCEGSIVEERACSPDLCTDEDRGFETSGSETRNTILALAGLGAALL